MSYTPKDLERADRFTLANPMVSNAAVAQLIADVRRVALEEAARIVLDYPTIPTASQGARDMCIAARIRALKDGAK